MAQGIVAVWSEGLRVMAASPRGVYSVTFPCSLKKESARFSWRERHISLLLEGAERCDGQGTTGWEPGGGWDTSCTFILTQDSKTTPALGC